MSAFREKKISENVSPGIASRVNLIKLKFFININ
jgi:hypothetical protein